MKYSFGKIAREELENKRVYDSRPHGTKICRECACYVFPTRINSRVSSIDPRDERWIFPEYCFNCFV